MAGSNAGEFRATLPTTSGPEDLPCYFFGLLNIIVQYTPTAYSDHQGLSMTCTPETNTPPLLINNLYVEFSRFEVSGPEKQRP